jgi:hypothetical protein
MAGPRLSNGVNDARKVAAALEGKGFEVTLRIVNINHIYPEFQSILIGTFLHLNV